MGGSRYTSGAPHISSNHPRSKSSQKEALNNHPALEVHLCKWQQEYPHRTHKDGLKIIQSQLYFEKQSALNHLGREHSFSESASLLHHAVFKRR